MKWFLVFFIIIFTNGCSIRYLQIKDKAALENIYINIDKYNERIHEVKATMDIRAFGLLKNYVHETIDVLADRRGFFLLSIRSFFNSPQALIAFDGQDITALDFAGLFGQYYQRVGIDRKSYFNLYNFPIKIILIPSLIFGAIPIRELLSVEIFSSQDEIKITGQMKDKTNFYAILSSDYKEIKTIVFNEKESRSFYEIDFSDYSTESGISFPKKRVLRMKNHSLRLKLDINFTELVLGQEFRDKENFLLSP